MQEFINLRRGGMSVKEYCIKLNQLFKYAPTIVAGSIVEDSREKMNKLLVGYPTMW